MNADNIIQSIRNGCIVSCQALEHEPLYSPDIMTAMALAAEEGGAVGIRANTPQDIYAIKRKCSLPLIGLYKSNYPGYDVYITPTMKEVGEIVEAGADMVAIDATHRQRPDGMTVEELVQSIRVRYPHVLIVADVSNYEEGIASMGLGVDLVSTTMSGYTPYSPQQEEPDIQLVAKLASLRRTPVLGEGRIWTIEHCLACFKGGAHAVVIGTAITRPQEITKRFVKAISTKVSIG